MSRPARPRRAAPVMAGAVLAVALGLIACQPIGGTRTATPTVAPLTVPLTSPATSVTPAPPAVPGTTSAAPSATPDATTAAAVAPAPVTPAVPPSGRVAGPIPVPDGALTDVRQYGAVGDGVTDDTAAIQRALADGRIGPDGKPTQPVPDQYNGRPKALFFPAGTYLVSDTLAWVGCCVTLQGQGSGATVIRLAPASPGFADPGTPKPVVRTESGNMSFRQNIWDLAVHVGAGNPGAVGVDYIANNSGALRNVEIVSEDGSGVAGIDQTRQWPGPSMIKNVLVQGFDTGIRVSQIEYSQTYIGVELRDQRVVGVDNDGAVMAIENLVSSNRVPVLRSRSLGLVTIVGATLQGGDPAAAALGIDTSAGTELYVRDITTSGYRAAVADAGRDRTGPAVDEWWSGTTVGAFPPDPGRLSLRLPVRPTPSYADADLSTWAAVTCSGYAPSCPVAPELQKQLDSGASTVYFPFGVRQVYDRFTVVVPPSVKRIVGFGGVINGGGPDGGGVRFVVADGSPDPLVIEAFGYGVSVEQRGARPVALKNGVFPYVSAPGAGDLYLEDAQVDGFTVQPGQHVWGRQVNNERRDDTKIVNNGGTLWILGMKTEGGRTVIRTVGGATEYLGGLLYPATDDLGPGEVAFESVDSRTSFLYSNIVYTTRNYDVQIRETRAGSTRDLTTDQAPDLTRFVVGAP